MQEIQVFLSIGEIERLGLWNKLRFYEIQDHVARMEALPEALKNAYAEAAVVAMASEDKISIDYPGLLEPEFYKEAMLHNIKEGYIYHLPDQELKRKELRNLAAELLAGERFREYDTLWNCWVGEALDLPWRKRDLIYPPLYSATVQIPVLKNGVRGNDTIYWIGTKQLSQLGFTVETGTCSLLDVSTVDPAEGIAFRDREKFANALEQIGDALKLYTELKARCRSGQEVFGMPTLKFEGEQSSTVWEIEHRKPAGDGEWGPLLRSKLLVANTMTIIPSLYGFMHVDRPARLDAFTHRWVKAFDWDSRCPAKQQEMLTEVVKDKAKMIAVALEPKLSAHVREHFPFESSLTIRPTLENGQWPAYAVTLKATLDEGLYEEVFYIDHCRGIDECSSEVVEDKFRYFIEEVESWVENLNNPEEEEEEDEY